MHVKSQHFDYLWLVQKGLGVVEGIHTLQKNRNAIPIDESIPFQEKVKL
jgi:hypothetical protein